MGVFSAVLFLQRCIFQGFHSGQVQAGGEIDKQGHGCLPVKRVEFAGCSFQRFLERQGAVLDFHSFKSQMGDNPGIVEAGLILKIGEGPEGAIPVGLKRGLHLGREKFIRGRTFLGGVARGEIGHPEIVW